MVVLGGWREEKGEELLFKGYSGSVTQDRK